MHLKLIYHNFLNSLKLFIISSSSESLKWISFFKQMVGTWKLSIMDKYVLHKYVSWDVRFSLDGFIYLISFGNKKIQLQLSDQPIFASEKGWFKFEYLKDWYYIRGNMKIHGQNWIQWWVIYLLSFWISSQACC